MADEIRELMNKKDEIEKEIKEYFDVLQSVGLMVSICYDFLPRCMECRLSVRLSVCPMVCPSRFYTLRKII